MLLLQLFGGFYSTFIDGGGFPRDNNDGRDNNEESDGGDLFGGDDCKEAAATPTVMAAVGSGLVGGFFLSPPLATAVAPAEGA